MLFSEPGEPDLQVTTKGHGRLEQRAVWLSSELADYSDFPGLSNVIMVRKLVKHLKSNQLVESVQYAVTSLSHIGPRRALSLMRGHWGIENSLFHIKDDSFGEDRHVMQHHGSGAVLSLLRNIALTLLRGACSLWSSKEPLTGRAQRLDAQPSVVLLPP